MSGPRLGDYFDIRQEPGRPGLPVMSVTMNDSLVFRDDLDRRTESALRPDQHLLVRKGDIAYNMMRMWQGACGLAQVDGIVSPAYVVLAPKPGIDSRFAYHWFKSARMIHLFRAYSHGLTEDRLRLYFDAFCEIPAAPPSLELQEQIVGILDTWDRAIDETELLIASYRRKRTALMLKLFGPAKVTSETTLPKGWRHVRLGDLCDFTSGLWVGAESPLVDVGVIRNTNFTEDGILDDTDIAYIPVEEKHLQNRKLSVGDIILERSGGGPEQPVGRVALFELDGGTFSFSNFTSALRIKQPRDLHFYYLHSFLHWVYLSGLTEVMQTRSTGIRNLDGQAYQDIIVPLPPVNEQERMVTILRASHDLLKVHMQSLAALRKQKRGLLQRMLIAKRPLDGRVAADLTSATAAGGDLSS